MVAGRPYAPGRHCRTDPIRGQTVPAPRQAEPTESAEPAQEAFDYARPFLIDLGRASLIAEVLRETGLYATADTVADELAQPDRYRTGIGRFAAQALAQAGWRP
jgi:nucleotide-binding universal stress UspA family protein